MSPDEFHPAESDSILDPPGSIAVLGTTPIGIETALYGRYLGYDVVLFGGLDRWLTNDCAATHCRRMGPTFQGDWFARNWLGDQSIHDRYDAALPMMPDRCLSSLAKSAIAAQKGDAFQELPATMRQWIEGGLWQITQTDLLRGRTFADTFVESIELAPVADDEDDSDGELSDREEESDDEEVPPDFRLHFSGEPMNQSKIDSRDFECVIVAGLPIAEFSLSFDLPAEYFFVIGQNDGSHCTDANQAQDAAESLRFGYQQITRVFAQLAGRVELDLYRPMRL